MALQTWGQFGVSMLQYNPGVMPSSSQPLNECSAKRFLQTSWKVTEQPGKTNEDTPTQAKDLAT